MNNSFFSSKILLFGEYSIVLNSFGFAIPYNLYKGSLKLNAGKKNKDSQKKILEFIEYLKKKVKNLPDLDWLSINKDKKNNLFFESNIPQGYGLGSSGALVAAFYDRYVKDKISSEEKLTKNKLQKLKNIFSEMESYYHGESSGIDPLNCYLGLPILIKSQNEIQVTKMPEEKALGYGGIFILDSGTSSDTSSMVSLFFKKMKDENFNYMMKNQFIKYSKTCINEFLNGDINSMFNSIKILSEITLKNFQPMIPNKFTKLWDEGIRTDNYFFKLCGSGGGGFLLGFTLDLERTFENLKDYKKEIIYKF
ncbi:MAG: mevalonate kinase [Flavobacteriaceae bacterium]|nr:mevalonate kinase [Flavobacteriaceae bacterium]